MNDREAFEAFLLSAEDDGYLNEREGQYLIWQAALATAPAWHPAPTVPGLWCTNAGDCTYIEPYHMGDSSHTSDGLRWYGPIPQEPAA